MAGIDINTTNLGAQADGQIEENQSNTRILALFGYGNDYGDREARQALAFADAGGGGGGGGTGGGAAPADVAAGIDASTDINALVSSQAALNDVIGTTSDVSSDPTISGKLIEIINTLNSSDANTITDAVVSVTTASIIISTADSNTDEVLIQNKSEVESIFVRATGTPTLARSQRIFPGDTVVFTGLKAKQAISAITEQNTAEVFVEKVLTI